MKRRSKFLSAAGALGVFLLVSGFLFEIWPFVARPKNERIMELVQHANEFEDAKNYRDAINALSQAIDLEDSNEVKLILLMRRGYCHRELGNWEEVLRNTNWVLAIDPRHADAHMLRAAACAQLFAYDEAIEELGYVILLQPENAQAFHQRAQYHAIRNELPSALADMDRCIEIDCNSALYYSSRASFRFWNADFAGAVADGEEAVRLNATSYPEGSPGRAYASHRLAMILCECTDPGFRDGTRAIQLATEACELTDWRDRLFLSTLASAYAEVGEFAKAVDWEKKALELAEPVNRPYHQRRLEAFTNQRPYRSNERDRRRPIPPVPASARRLIYLPAADSK